MEAPRKETDVNLKSILSSPVKHTPAVPVPDWSPPTPVPAPDLTSGKSNPRVIQVSIPGLPTGEPYTNIALQNCVATVDMHTTLNLQLINAKTRNTEFNPQRFHGLIMRIREPKTTALIFRSGKIVCTGARNEFDALIASKKFARVIQKLGFHIKFANFKVQNLVATCDLKFPIKLENLNHMHGQFSRSLRAGTVSRTRLPDDQTQDRFTHIR
ncbi:TATA-box-binding protein 2 isoform X2 [Dendroctonus ponderosae]|uniref:TATA-box-binding protein n=1 Tax=Dendroctonus ponderosae TaxID=77166 RepID=A0AAR5PYG8_DENPD|nr:TATA-box-binding protein 2 isoform X2 [Dendroctonus ponderosae]